MFQTTNQSSPEDIIHHHTETASLFPSHLDPEMHTKMGTIYVQLILTHPETHRYPKKTVHVRPYPHCIPLYIAPFISENFPWNAIPLPQSGGFQEWGYPQISLNHPVVIDSMT
jgi:hypothetical protein